MLARLLDAAQLQRACSIDADAFMQCAITGALPPAVGMYGGRPVWTEPAVQAFAGSMAFAFDPAWHASEPVPVAAAAPVVEPAPAPVADPWPSEMPQGMACEYLEVSASWFARQEKTGILSGTRVGAFKVYLRKDLDALRELPVYVYRKRHGFTHGRPIKDRPQKAAPPALATADDYLGETAAADYLNIPRETLALARGSGAGPVCIYSNGSPKYKVADLDAWQAKNGAQRKVAKAIRSTTRNMPTAAAADYLGITPKQLQNLCTHSGPKNKPPAHDTIDLTGAGLGKGRARMMFSAADLEAWRNANPDRLQSLIASRTAGHAHRMRQIATGKAKPGGRPRKVRQEPGPAKAATPTRKTLNGQPMRA